MALGSFVFKDITLGLNDRVDPRNLQPGEASFGSVNVLPAERGTVVSSRNGLITFNTLPASTRVQNIYEWPSKNFLILAQDNDVYSQVRVLNSAYTKRFDSAIAGHRPWCFEIAKNLAGVEMLWMVNGIDVPQKWDGVTATTVPWAGGVPPTGCTWIRLWKNRMVAGGNAAFPERLYYSTIGNPELPNPWNFIDIRSAYDDNDTIVWSELQGDNLLVFKSNSTWLVYDSNTFANRRLGYPGVPHENCTCQLLGVTYFLNKDGLWTCDGVGDPHPVAINTSVVLSPDDVSSRGAQLTADPENERLIIIQPVTNSSINPTNWRTFVYYPPNSLNNPHNRGTIWQIDTTPDTTFLALVQAQLFPGDPVEYVLISAHHVSPRIYQFLRGIDDNGTAVTANWKSGAVQLGGSIEKMERVRRVNISMVSDAQLILTADSGLVTFTQTTTVADVNGNMYRIRPELRGRYFQLQVVKTVGRFSIYNIEFIFRGGKEHTK